MRPEAGAILAYPPAFVLEATIGGSFRQVLFGTSAINGLLGIEPGEMLVDDFLCRVAADRFRSSIPAQNSPLPIEREDGIVLDVFDQDSKALFARSERRL